MKRAAFLVLLFGGLTIAMAAPWSLHPRTRVVVNTTDTHLFLWTIGWNAHAFVTSPLSIFDANIYHPYPNTLAYSENLIGSAMLAAPVIWATGDLVLALNVMTLLSCMLCGIGAYMLGRRIGLGVPAAVIAGIVFAFAPSRFFRIGQAHLNAVQWLPFGLAWLHAYFDGGRPRDLRLSLACLAMQALTAGHGAVFLGVSMVALSLYRLALGEPLAILRRIRDVGVTGALLAAPAILVLLPYRRAQAEMGLKRTLENWTVTPESYLASPTRADQWLLSLFTDRRLEETASAFLFPGWLVLMLGVFALLLHARAALPPPVGAPAIDLRRNVWFYALLAIVSVLFIVDRPLGLWPWVYSWPGFNFIRVPSRFAILTTLALAMLAGAAIEGIAAPRTRRGRAAVAVVAGALLLAEFAVYPFPGDEYAIKIPAIVRWLETQPKPFVVAEVPITRASNRGPFERFQTFAMLHTTGHWQKTIHGYSGIRPPLHDRVYRELNVFPDEVSMATLRELGVTHVVVHRNDYPPDLWPGVEARLHQTPGLRLLHSEADGEVYQVLSQESAR